MIRMTSKKADVSHRQQLPRARSQRTPWWRDKAASIRTGVIAAGVSLALAGCGALLPGDVSDGASAAAQGPGPGVTEDSVKVVFVAVDLDAVQETTGFKTASVGDQKKQIKALETWVNDNGGLGGRKMEAVFRLYDAQADSPAAEEQLCNQITQDDRAFAVVLTGQYQTNARPCYAQRKTLMLDASLVASDVEYYEELSPYLWSASFPEYATFIKSFVKVLDDEGFFEGEKSIGIVGADTDANRRTVTDVALPLLKEAGVDVEVGWVDTTDIGTLYAGHEQAIDTFRSKKVDRVTFFGGSRLASIFATVAASKQFTARYAISSFDNPSFFVNNPTLIPDNTMDGMVGVGFHPPQDVADDQMPFPTGETEVECLDVFKDAGVTFETRESARVALPYCDAVKVLKMGADNASGDLNAGTWAEAVHANGSEFRTAAGFGGALGDGGFAGAGGYRVLKYDDGCSCFVYEGDEVPFE
ncbi:ABC transporter substrate-binding protein [Nocardioides pantholopis]|uniref:ABC transporter substrate-binding protein n=1 Tax=Nocardioides pantholopis TaxID=2483798 RepID=UPI000F07FC9F|nr:ABC transporter substrate-binding protein [Nocardioides pantholopis]